MLPLFLASKLDKFILARYSDRWRKDEHWYPKHTPPFTQIRNFHGVSKWYCRRGGAIHGYRRPSILWVRWTLRGSSILQPGSSLTMTSCHI